MHTVWNIAMLPTLNKFLLYTNCNNKYAGSYLSKMSLITNYKTQNRC